MKEDGAKAKEEVKKLKTKLKQVITKLKEARDGVIDLMKVNFKATIDEYKRGPEF